MDNVSKCIGNSPEDVLLLVPEDTSPTSCLQIHCTRQQGFLDIIVSEYECLYGHRKSLLLLEKLPNTRGDLIEINEGKFCDISMALKYIHSDTSALCFSECSALTYAHTGHFMKMDRLCKQVISQASEALSVYINDPVGAISNKDLPMTVWDAIAILHLFDDPDSILGNINYTDWYQRTPTLFADPTLFSSCRHIYNPDHLAEFIRGIQQAAMNKMTAFRHKAEEDVDKVTSQLESLAIDTANLLAKYKGRQVVSKCDRKDTPRCGVIKGVIQNVVRFNGSSPKICIMWRHSGRTSEVDIDELVSKYDIVAS